MKRSRPLSTVLLILGIMTHPLSGQNDDEQSERSSKRRGFLPDTRFFGISNRYYDDLTGLQLGLASNMVQGDLTGLQLAGLANVTGGRMGGLQAAGLANVAGQSALGGQVSLLANVAGGAAGVQLTGLANVAAGGALLQAAGLTKIDRMAGMLLEVLEKLDAVFAELECKSVDIQVAGLPSRLWRCPACDRAAVDRHDVVLTRVAQMESRTRAEHTAADDHRVC